MEHIALHIRDIRQLLVNDHLARPVNELDITIIIHTGQPIREHPSMVIFRFNDNLPRVLAEIATLLAVTVADEGIIA